MLSRGLIVRVCLQPPEVTVAHQLDLSTPLPLSTLVGKLMGCLHHLEQVGRGYKMLNGYENY